MTRTVEQWAYGAILDYWERWNEARRSAWRNRPRARRSGSAALAFALAGAISAAPQGYRGR